jgi:Uncharacterized conserved protein (DUF2285)
MTRAHGHPLIDPCGRLRTTRDAHFRIALRLLDADAESADWREVARLVLHLDPERDSDRARKAFESHLSRAKWMTEHGYRHLLRGVEYCGRVSRRAEPREITGSKSKADVDDWMNSDRRVALLRAQGYAK